MLNREPFTVLSVRAVFLACLLQQVASAEDVAQARIESPGLRAVVADNAAYGKDHRKGYSGLSELYHGSSKRTLFVPAYAGLNYEHIFSGDSTSYGWNIFEPRIAPPRALRRSSHRSTAASARRAWALSALSAPLRLRGGRPEQVSPPRVSRWARPSSFWSRRV